MLKTEMRNPNTMHFDKMSSAEQVAAMCRENQNAVLAVEKATPQIAKAIDAIAEAFRGGHRLFFIGAGTSGRLGVLDAAECPPTFGVSYEMVQGIIAGGKERMFRASENDEDKQENGVADVKNAGIGQGDVLVGVSVAGGAAYVVGALKAAREAGAVTVALTSNFDTPIEKCADITIITDTGAEVITGSTRLKAGTAHKMVMNMMTTCAMAQTGKVYENMMINLRPSNIKLKARVVRITKEILGCSEEEAIAALEANEWNIRRAVSVKE
ncbi:MAG: N-acetylmuramic acid 6-phosphate etherase [Clostridia bacterium]|nr:N-acetylmuramic acid 6-phosphate etherase [Clostridia bacterium]